jgi:hypothetical protein
MFNPEDGGKTILRNFRNCAKSYKNQTVGTQQRHSREDLKSDNSKACGLNLIPLGMFSF